MAEEDRPREVVTKYAKVKDQIMKAIFRSSADPFFRSFLENLQKTVLSMEPMVEDMDLSEIASPRYIFMTSKFLPLLEQVEDNIRRILEMELSAASCRVGIRTATVCQAFGIELPFSSKLAISCKKDLEFIRKRLKDLYADYVKEELDKLALSNQEMADNGVLELLRYLLTMIRHEASKPSHTPIFMKLKLILDFLEADFHSRTQQSRTDHISPPAPSNMPRLLCLLSEVKLLYRFLNGVHGLDILDHLRESEYALRMFVSDDHLVSSLYWMDQHHKEQQRIKKRLREMVYMIGFEVILLIVCTLNHSIPTKFSEIEYADLITLGGILVLVVSFYYLLLTYDLAMQVTTYVSQGHSHAHRQISKSKNQRYGGLHFHILAAVVVVAIAIAVALAVTDEPKKYDIFLNFRGSKEIRYTVAGVFHTSLEKANISTFFDERNSRKTKRFLDEIESAISTSLGAVTIFSEHYGESEYCLNELLLILEREKTYKGYIIRPIFYDVEPDDLTDPESKFGQGLQKHYKTQWKEKVEEWKEALETVTLIGGDVHKSSYQHLDELVDKVVEDFKNQLGNKRGTDDNTILKWRSLVMKVTQPFTLQLRNVKLVIDLKNWKVYTSAS